VLSRSCIPSVALRCLLDFILEYHISRNRHLLSSLLLASRREQRVQLRYLLCWHSPGADCLHSRGLDLVHLARLRSLQNVAGRLHEHGWRTEGRYCSAVVLSPLNWSDVCLFLKYASIIFVRISPKSLLVVRRCWLVIPNVGGAAVRRVTWRCFVYFLAVFRNASVRVEKEIGTNHLLKKVQTKQGRTRSESIFQRALT